MWRDEPPAAGDVLRFKAHPTKYAGATFRSRLEARWAAFFDLAGWSWEYEPCDLEGWCPDFALIGRTRVTMVEVKPINWVACTDAMMHEALSRPDLAKARQPAEGHETLVLGSYPVLEPDGFWGGVPTLGVILNEDWMGDADIAHIWMGIGRPLDFTAAQGSYAHRIGGTHEGDHHLEHVSYGFVSDLWNAAGAAVQWKPR